MNHVPQLNGGNKLEVTLKKMGISDGKLGIDYARTDQDSWETLSKYCTSIKPQSGDDLMRELRIIKEQSEIEKLELASRYSELGIVATLNHSEGTIDAVSYGRAEAAERIRVHVGEFGGHAVGNIAALQNSEIRQYYGKSQGRISENGFIRYDVTSAFRGILVKRRPHSMDR